MNYRSTAGFDFDRAYSKAFWRKLVSWITRKNNKLLPYDEVKNKVPIRGQHYIGLREVPLEHIVGSIGRYQDFDRAFLPRQAKTKSRWVSIDVAHMDQVILPPVELYKMGEIYFVKDGNHRVSVARERGQLYIDAYVTEVDVPVPLTTDVTIDDLDLKRAYAEFLEKTRIDALRPGADLESKVPGQHDRLLEHIEVHRWYLGENRKAMVPYDEAVISWYDNVYMPVVEFFRQQSTLKELPRFSESDLYLWVMEYQAYLREAYGDEISSEGIPGSEAAEVAHDEAVEHFTLENPQLPIGKLINIFRSADWLDETILRQERAAFFKRTNLAILRPQNHVASNMLGQYERLLGHIDVHRWYLGEIRKGEVPYEQAVLSWFDNVYQPLIKLIQKQGIISQFPERTETDLYMWVVNRQDQLINASPGSNSKNQ